MTGGLPSIEDLLKQSSAPAKDPVSDSNKTPSKPSTAPKVLSDPEPIKEELKGKTLEEMSPAQKLDRKMAKIEIGSKEKEAEGLAKVQGIPYINLVGFAISPDALRLIPEKKAIENKTIAFLYTGPELRIASVNPENEDIKQIAFGIGERFKTNAVLYKITEDSFDHAVKLYRTLPKIRTIVKGVQIKAEELEQYQSQMESFKDIDSILKQASITDVLAVVVAASVKLGSSDIHIEAEEKGIAVRLRVDGILQDVANLDVSQWKKIINRIKLIAGLKLNITDKPQDGRFTIYQKDKKIDVRTSTLPTAWGESVVMRILNPDAIELEFEQLGFRKAAFERLAKEIEKPHGMVITTGPTGSGKTTTLYAILKRLNKPGVKIITLEDPVEYKLKGINQSQIDHSKEYTFAKGLRSILRQDPDIVLVGEIRDLETAETAIQASLTGHLLLSTIHTNDAAGAIPRFTAMGVKPFLLAPSLNAIMGQRLVRRVCESCKQEDTIEPDVLAKVKELLDAIPENSGEPKPKTEAMKFFKGAGCEVCNKTGYKGRVGIYEVLVKDQNVEKFILEGDVSEYKMREVATAQGMISMAQDGLLKAMEGQTSIEEIARVTGF
ncbi:type II/IV secretion system protein [Candidatus Uhrbacteria bacterium]|jgi:type IV pilus assembly protein PilB|nr:type II/IV secretion system protein [Candidatus Uhrbacteria bacterium]MBT7717041.1 type II/IV secretion system protein [Candidatus Uhrbacteria bacterium]